jgi:DNA-directed RNA polymerase subunit RPC12/RpoP
MIATFLLLGTGGAVGAAYWVLRARSAKETVFYRFRCPACSQKVRYAAEKAGRAGMCPRCGQQWTLPTEPQILPASDYLSNRHAVGRRLAPASGSDLAREPRPRASA